jgi:hypothetical protein
MPWGALDRPTSLLPLSGPLAQQLVAVQGGGDALLALQPTMLIQRGRGVGGLMRIDTDRHRHAGTFLERWQENTGRADRLWAGTVLC